MLSGLSGLRAQAVDGLASYAADRAAVSVSGVSSGGYMAQQYHVAHSRQVMGAGILAAGPWNCAETVLLWPPVVTATQVCSHTAGFGTPFSRPARPRGEHRRDQASGAGRQHRCAGVPGEGPCLLVLRNQRQLGSAVRGGDGYRQIYVAFGGRLRIPTKITHKLNYRGCCLLGVRGAMKSAQLISNGSGCGSSGGGVSPMSRAYWPKRKMCPRM